MKPRARSHWITLAGLLALAGLMLARVMALEPLSTRIAVGLLALLPLGLLVLASGRDSPKWGTWAATWMIPYFAVALGEMLIRPLTPATLAWPLLTVVVFFAGLDASRRTF
jgi:uncharacterized membrane protein